MKPSIRQDFAFSVSLDNGLLRQSIASGESIPPSEILNLAAAIEAIYISVTLESRQMDRVRDCHLLWSEFAQLLGELCNSWTGVDTDDPSITWLRNRLQHYLELAYDRRELFTVSERERREFQERRSIEVETSFGEREYL
jgi:hypothetical protein